MPGLTADPTVRELPPDMVSWLAEATPPARPRAAFVLWDLSDLLPGSAQLDMAAHRAAFQAVTGHPPDAAPCLEAGTDPRIALELLVSDGLPRDRAVRLLPRLLPELAGAARHLLSQRSLTAARLLTGEDTGPGTVTGPGRRTRLLPGDITAADGTLQSVISRNMRPVALAKLTAAGLEAAVGLESVLDAGIGAYGCDDARLDRLVPIACARAARRHQAIVEPAGTVVVTSSPSSAMAAWRAGASVIYPRPDGPLTWGRGASGHAWSQDPAAHLERLAYH